MVDAHPLSAAFVEVLNRYTASADIIEFELTGEHTFYSPSKGEMAAYRVKPITFDIYLSLIIATYIFALRVAIKGRSAFSLQPVTDLLSGSK
jgi:hypothetical protein